jgi:hypothetical protein
MVCRNGANITRHDNDFTVRFPLAAAVAALPSRSFLIYGEAVRFPFQFTFVAAPSLNAIQLIAARCAFSCLC